MNKNPTNEVGNKSKGKNRCHFFCNSSIFSIGLLCVFIFFILVAKIWKENNFIDTWIAISTVDSNKSDGQIYWHPDNPENYSPHAAIYKFPPLYAAFLMSFDKLGFNLKGMYIFIFIFNIALYIFSVLLLYLSIIKKGIKKLIYIFSVCLVFAPFYETLRLLQLEIYILFLISASIYFLSINRKFLSGVLIGISACLKIYPIVVAINFVFDRNWKGMAGVLAACLGCVIYGIYFLGYFTNQIYFFKILPILIKEMPVEWTNISFSGLIYHLVGNQNIAYICRFFIVIFLLHYFIKDILKKNRNQKIASLGIERHIILTTFILIYLPNAWGGYQLLLLPCYIFLYEAYEHEKRLRKILVVSTLILGVASLDLLVAFFPDLVPKLLPYINKYEFYASLYRSFYTLVLFYGLLKVRKLVD